MAIVGSAYVEIRALSAKFNKDIEKSLRDSLDGVGKDLGKQVGDDFADEYKKSVESKLGKKFKVPAPDTDEATKKIRKLGNESEGMFTRMRKNGTSSMRSISSSLKDMDDHLLHTLGTMVKFGGGFSGLIMTFDAAGAIIGSLLGSISALVSGLFALGSAIAPAAKAAAILPGLLSAIITPALTASLALTGLGKAYTAGAAAAAGGKEELKKYREALKKLNPEQAEFVMHLLRHKSAIDDVKNAASEQIFVGLSAALDEITSNKFLPLLSKGLSDAGGALGYVANNVARIMGQGFFQRSFSSLMESNAIIIRRLGRAFGDLIGIFVLVARAARPFTEEFASWIELITSNWLTSARGNFSGLISSIEDGVEVAKQLGDIFGNVIRTIGNIGAAAAPAGKILLDAFEGATVQFEHWTRQGKNQDRMEEFFLNVADTTRAIGRLLVVVVREFLKLGENDSFVKSMDILAESTIPKIFRAMDKLVSAVGDDFIGILDTLATMGDIMADSGGIESYLEVMQGLLDILKGILEIPGFATLAGKLLAITAAVKALSLIGKFTGLKWLVNTGLPGLKDGIGNPSSPKGMATRLGLIAAGLVLVREAAAKVNPEIRDTTTTLEDFFDRVGESVEVGKKDPIAGVTDFFNGIMEQMDKSFSESLMGFGIDKDTAGALAHNIGATVFTVISGIPLVPQISAFLSGLAQKIDWGVLWDFLSTPQVDWSGIGGKIVDDIQSDWEVVKRVTKKAWDAVWGFISTPMVDWSGIGGKIVDDIKSDWGVVSRVTKRVWNGVTGAISGAVTRAKDAVTNTLGGMRIAATNNFNTIKRVAVRVWNGITSTISGAVSRARKAVSNTLGGMKIVATNNFNTIRRVAGKVWSSITGAISGAVTRARRAVSSGFGALRTNVSNIFQGIRKTAGNVWSSITSSVTRHTRNLSENVRNVLSRARTLITNIWRGIRSSVTRVAQDIFNSVTSRFKRLRSSVVAAFTSAKNGIRRAWNGIRSAAREPVEYVINTVYNRGLRRAFNKINDVLPGVKDLPVVPFGGGGSASGGSRPASDRGFATGGWTGPGSKFKPAGVVHADEFVVKKESRKRIESRLPGLLDYINQKGKLPGFAGGGLVPGASDWWRKRGAALSEHPAFGGVTGGGHMPGSLHYSGNAIDLNYRGGNEMAFFDKWMPAFKRAFPSMGTIWRAAGHYNHAHIDTGGTSLGMGAKGGGGFSLPSLGSLINPIKAVAGKLKGLGGNTKLGEVLRGSGRSMVRGAVRLATNKFNSAAASAGDYAKEAVSNLKSTGVKGVVRGLAATRGWGAGKQWDALDWLVNKESGWNPNAANPTSSARGLFQKMTSIHGPAGNVLDQARWGLKYIADRYGSPIKAAAFHRSHNYYADGGRVSDVPVFDNGGILGKGLNLINNATGGPEALVRPEQFSPKGLAAEYRALTKVIERAFGSRGQMASAGSNVVSGLIKGMRSGTGLVKSAASDVTNNVIDTARNLLGIQSPSKVFRGFGLNIDRGLVKGLLAGRKELSKAISSTIDDIMDYADDRVDKSADNILESYRRANQKIRAQNKKIAAYNRTHKKDKNSIDSLQVPTRKQAEERAMDRLGYNKAGIAKASRITKQMAALTKSVWKRGGKEGIDYLLRAADKFRRGAALYSRVSLGDMSKGAEILNNRLDSARTKLKEMTKEQRALSSEISGGLSSSLSLTNATTSTGVEDIPASLISLQTISAQVKGLSQKAKKLAWRLGQLIKSGMPKSLVQEIAGLGIDEGLTVAKAILDGTRAEQKQLYKDYNAIDPATKRVGDVVSEQMFSVGVDAQKGLIKGLEADKKSLTKAAQRLAKKLESEVKKALGIRSPSRVFAELGKFLPLGLAAGIESQTDAALSAVSRLSGQMSNAFDPTLSADASLSGLSAAGRRAGSDIVGADGLTARDRAIIAAIQDSRPTVQQTINPPPQMDIFTLAKLVSRELEFRGQ